MLQRGVSFLSDHYSIPAFALFVLLILFAAFLTLSAGESLPAIFRYALANETPTENKVQVTKSWIRVLRMVLLAPFGLGVGLEGAAAEFSLTVNQQSLPRSFRWFETRRRTLLSSCLAASLSVVFAAPFAAILIPFEMSFGGDLMHVALVSVMAYLFSLFFHSAFLYLFPGTLLSYVPSHTLSLGYTIHGHVEVMLFLVSVLGFGLFSGAFAALFNTGLSRWNLFLSKRSSRSGKILGFIIALLFVFSTLGTVFWKPGLSVARLDPSELINYLQGLLLMSGTDITSATLGFQPWLWIHMAVIFVFLSLATFFLYFLFGSLGIFTPLFLIGALLGMLLNAAHVVAPSAEVSAWIAGASLLGAALGAPISIALLCYEMVIRTHPMENSGSFLMTVLASVFLANRFRIWLRAQPLFKVLLSSHGLSVEQGRLKEVLDAIPLSRAMVSDFQVVPEGAHMKDLRDAISKSKYPFLVVVSAQGLFRGLITIDLLTEVLLSRGVMADALTQDSLSLDQLFAAEDLLYRHQLQRTLWVHDSHTLSDTSALLQEHPCLAVLDSSHHAKGLVFAHRVRELYDHEVARRGLRRLFESSTTR